MILTMLGTGTSIGVPAIGCGCEVCRSAEPKDRRTRASALVDTDEGVRILIDCGPDFRTQILRRPFSKLDAVLITHTHYDHVGGMDDLRPFGLFGDVEVYGSADTAETLRHTMPYCFAESLYPGVPQLRLNAVRPGEPFRVSRPEPVTATFPPSGASLGGEMNTKPTRITQPAAPKGVVVTPVTVMHGHMPILGYRIGNLGYITDMKTCGDDTLRIMRGVDTLVVNALRFKKEHHSHQLVDDAVSFARETGARRTLLTHMTHDIGTHKAANARLPHGVEFAYDGQHVTVRE